MSRRRNRRAPPKEYAERVPRDVRIAYTELLDALSRADSQAVEVSRATGISHERVVNLTEAGNIPRARERSLRSEEHTSELQSPDHLVCRLLLEKKKNDKQNNIEVHISTVRYASYS